MRIILNPDKEHVEKMRAALKKNEGFCPCLFEKSEDTKCRCKEFREQVENKIPGACHCGLWIAVED